jgi:CheY-like chemotaxis protein
MPHRILLVEDNPASLELMRYLLASAGHETLLATNGQEAIQHLAAALPDLVVTDIQMPGLDGYELLAHIRADLRLRALRVIALTAYSMPGDRERVMSAGFDGYMSKPIDPETILQDVQTYLSAHRPGAPGEGLR